LLPIKSEIAGDKNIKFNSNVFTEKKTTEHFLLRHGHYNVKLLGEEIGKVNGISNLNQEFKVLIRGSFYN
jgi:hypothetical protein